MLLQVIFLPAVLVTAKSTLRAVTTDKSGKGIQEVPESIAEDEVDPFGMAPYMVKMEGVPNITFPLTRMEPRVKKPAKNVSLPVIARRRDSVPSMNMFPGFLDDIMIRSVFDALDDISANERMNFLPIDILDTNPDLPGSKPVVKSVSQRPGSIKRTTYKGSRNSNTFKTSSRTTLPNNTTIDAHLSNHTQSNHTAHNKTVDKAGKKNTTKNTETPNSRRFKRCKVHPFVGSELFQSRVNYDPFSYDHLDEMNDIKLSVPDPINANFSETDLRVVKFPTYRVTGFRDIPPSILLFRMGFGGRDDLTSKTTDADVLVSDNSNQTVYCRFGSQEFSIYKCSALVYIFFSISVLISGYVILHTRKCHIQRNKGSVIRI